MFFVARPHSAPQVNYFGGYQADAVLKHQSLLSNSIFVNEELYGFVRPHRRPEGRPTVYSNNASNSPAVPRFFPLQLINRCT